VYAALERVRLAVADPHRQRRSIRD
jgi:hypothetical protein